MPAARISGRDSPSPTVRFWRSVCIALAILLVARGVLAQANRAKLPAGDTATGAAPSSSPDAAPVTSDPPVLPWEYAPYRIRVWVAAAASAELDQRGLEALRREMLRRGESLVDASWSLDVVVPPAALESTVAYAPDLLTDAEIGRVDKSLMRDDKIIWVSLRTTPQEFVIRARELDCHTRTWSRIVESTIRQPEMLAKTAFDMLLAVFSPLARIDEGQARSCVCRVRAGGLGLPPDSPAFIGTGDVLQPVFRQNDRSGDPLPNQIQVLPYTFLQVKSVDARGTGQIDCNVHSGMRNPIQGRGTSRRERWALKIRSLGDSTELIVTSRPMTRGEPSVPLAGMEVYAKNPVLEPPRFESEKERQDEEQRNPPELLGVTDWRGSVTLSRADPQLRLVYVKSGGLLLARVPMVVGLEKTLVAEVADDNPRLQAEGFVSGMSGEITDLVVQRQLLRIRFRKRLAEGKLDDAERLLDEFRGLKSLNDLQRALDQQMTRQKTTANQGVKLRIEKLYADEREMIAKYVDVEMLNQLQLELAEARRNPSVVRGENVDTAAKSNNATVKKKLPADSKGSGPSPGAGN